MSFLADIHSYWLNNNTLNTALPATSVYTGLIPENTAFPYAVITAVNLAPTFTTGTGYFSGFTFQISVFDTDPDNVESLANTIGGQFDLKSIASSQMGLGCLRQDGPVFVVDQDTPKLVYHAYLVYLLYENKDLGNT